MRRVWLACLLAAASLCGADEVPLWSKGAPGSEGKTAKEIAEEPNASHAYLKVWSIHNPSLLVYLPPKGKATGAAVVVAPGGGHSFLALDIEGLNVGKYLSERGVATFVLKYRLAREKESTYTVEGHALADTHRAIRLIRSRAAEWGVDPNRVGVMGFSAGGQLAALSAVRDAAPAADSSDPIDQLNAKPAFQALIYPAIPRDMALSPQTPPAFLACGENDRVNISQGLPELYLAMRKAGASAELHVYAGVGHGFGLRENKSTPENQWAQRFVEWLDSRGFLKPKQ
ncbi:MAG TPA: alpha/beta hydrolase [Bryobacteraceae bacterium]|nr:alpha/beta hydrolase [Bryobacteraceae bacterium]